MPREIITLQVGQCGNQSEIPAPTSMPFVVCHCDNASNPLSVLQLATSSGSKFALSMESQRFDLATLFLLRCLWCCDEAAVAMPWERGAPWSMQCLCVLLLVWV
jgi:hypothetical protein